MDDSDDDTIVDECQICEKVMNPTNPPHIGACSHCVCMRCLSFFDRYGYDCPFCKLKDAFIHPIRNNLALDLLDNVHHLEAQVRKSERTNSCLQRLLETVKRNRNDLLIDAQLLLKNQNFGAKLTWRRNPFRKFWRKIIHRNSRVNYLTETTDIYEDEAEDMRLRLLESLHKIQALEEENRILKNAVNEMTVSYQEKDADLKKLETEYRLLVHDRNNLSAYNSQFQRDIVHLERQIDILLLNDRKYRAMNDHFQEDNIKNEEEPKMAEDVQM